MSQKDYKFDNVPERRETGALKFDALDERYGNPDLIPMWVADMDFEVAPEISEALIARFRHPVYGYATVPESYWESIINWVRVHYHIDVVREDLA